MSFAIYDSNTNGVRFAEKTRNVPVYSEGRSVSKMAWHHVNDLEVLVKEIDLAKTAIKKLGGRINPSIAQAEFDTQTSKMIENYLLNNLATLDADVDQMSQIIFS